MSKTPNPAAVALGKLRAKTLTAEHQAAASKARHAKLTPEERSEAARQAVTARWKRKRKRKPARD